MNRDQEQRIIPPWQKQGISMWTTLVLLLCCVVCAHSSVTGTILNMTLLQDSPGAGSAVLTTLFPSNVVQILCKTASTLVYDDPWWLLVNYVTYIPPGSSNATTILGWVADFDVDCGNVGNCAVAQC